MHLIESICNSLYNLEVVTDKAYTLLVFAVDPKSDKRLVGLILKAVKALMKFVGRVKKAQPAIQAVSAVGSSVYGNQKYIKTLVILCSDTFRKL